MIQGAGRSTRPSAEKGICPRKGTGTLAVWENTDWVECGRASHKSTQSKQAASRDCLGTVSQPMKVVSEDSGVLGYSSVL